MLDELDEFCARALAEHGCASVSVAVAERDELVLTRAYGQASVADQQPATPETVYGLASITKAFTATALCLAADEDLLDLDTPIPGSFQWTAPTPRQLLQHRGGFPAFYNFYYDTGPLPIDINRYRTLVREPGTDFEYSNIGYHELGRLLEAVTGQNLGDYLRERITEPLGLTSFGYGPAYAGPAPVAQRYSADGRAYATCFSGHPAAGAGWATAGDIARFARTTSQLLKPATIAAMHDAVPINEHLGYGLGRIVSRGIGPVIRSHGGGMGGVAAMMIEIPERELSVAVLANSTNKAARDAIVDHLVGILAPGFSSDQLNPVTEQTRPMALAQGEWAGEISTAEGDIPLWIRILANGQVEIRLADGPPVTASAIASQRWDLRVSARMQIATADARLNSPSFGLELRAERDRLAGRAIAFKDGDRDGWLGAYLVHPCVLRSN
ncbi:CubicO group peptidase (beta-lactamase class C family) [Kitasatospora sp. MAA4]|uniref:serine hydrolase domain-containing protein n=1 Tax=Kitasatospora sp. MAA4 TaxID=3035093 RepID=UPI0024753FA7|nr:serine hydrolase domain-containing protein [Kitasatospora sp. MAA4]MDH6137568.1 CubicO group peptidase (beta-lactamase class C family) [Kitasatospora sp. MAA4]